MAEHLTILEPDEIYDLYAIPSFDKDQRMLFFDLSEVEQQKMLNYRTPLSRLYFILQLGYFKAKQQFYVFGLNQVTADKDYLLERYFSQELILEKGIISKPTRLAQQNEILALHQYQKPDELIREKLLERACQFTTRHSKPIYIFRELIGYMEQYKIVLPAYTTIQRLTEHAVSLERQRLEKIITTALAKEEKQLFKALLTDQSKGFYLLTWLQKEPPNFNTYPMRGQIERKLILHPLYKIANRILAKLDISGENTRYYGQLATHYPVYKLNQFKGDYVCLLLLCFVHYRYQQVNDTLIEAFKINVRSYQTEAKKAAKEFIYRYRVQVNQQMAKVPKILSLFIDDTITDDIPFGIVRKDAFALLEKNEIVLINNHIEQNHVDEDERKWEYYEEIQRKITLNIRPLFKCLDFHGRSNSTSLMDAITAINSVFKTGKTLNQVSAESLPKGFIPRHLNKYIVQEDKISASRYEMLLYTTIRNQIEAGNLFIKDSLQHKSFEEDLLSDEKWEGKETILKRLDIPKLSKPVESLLEEMEKLIEEKYKLVNRALANGENKAISLQTKKDGSTKWKLKYEPDPEPYNHRMYKQFQRIGIIPLLKWVDKKTDFLSVFTHLLGKRGNKKLNKESVLASLIGYGTNQGLSALSDRCDISFHELNGTAYNFFRQETLRNANKILVDKMAELPMFEYYNLQKRVVHSSSDGQKFGTLFDTINARYSAKYFGLSKGVPIYTLVANHIPVNAKVIGAHEYEGHFVFDLLYNNPTKVKPKIHSTDMHGINQVNFAILDFFDYQFAPRFTQIGSELTKLYGFQPIEKYSNNILRPSHKVNKKLIIEEWDNIQRIIASLAVKTTTQSTIISKLASYKRNNRTQQALLEYDNLIRTYYMLNYIHSKTIRKNVQKALNRGEGYHRLRRKIAYDNEGKFRVHSQVEQHIWSDSSRLIANTILFYNLYLLSSLLKISQSQNNTKQLELLKRISPVAWTHINIYGTYHFLEATPQIDLNSMIEAIDFDALFKKVKTN